MSNAIKFGLVVTAVALCCATGIKEEAQAAPAAIQLSAAQKARLAAFAESSGIDTVWRRARDHAVAHAINGDDYECGPTDFDDWINESFSNMNFPVFLQLAQAGVLDWPAYYGLLLDNDGSDEFIGIDGKQTKELVKRHRSNQRFWDVETDDVLLMGMHSGVIADDAKMVPLVEFLYGMGTADAQDFVDYVQSVIDGEPTIGYDNPWFSLNAFAFSAVDEPAGSPFAGLPDKILMGDGIMEMLADIGLGTDGPDYVHAHEFAHHVQYELGLLADYGGSPEETRRIELMADALGAYYCAHARGATFQAKRIAQGYAAAYAVGDCAFANPGHHGTPNQRDAATRWGAGVATSAKKQGKIESAEDMADMFDDVLADIVAPDAD